MRTKLDLSIKLLTVLCHILALQFFSLSIVLLKTVVAFAEDSGNVGNVGNVTLGSIDLDINDEQSTETSVLNKQQEVLRGWLVNNSVIHFSLDKRMSVVKKHFMIIETKNLIKLYKARNFSPIWINLDYQQNQMVKMAQEYMISGSLRHGMNPSDYATFELKTLTAIPNDAQNWMYLELIMTEAFVRMGKDLATGRLNFSLLEKEFKLKRAEFKSFEYLQSAMNAHTDAEFAIAMDKLAPSSDLYNKLLMVLETLGRLEASSEWKEKIKLSVDIKYGLKDVNTIHLRQRLSDLGYSVELGSPIFDDNFLAAVREFQTLNGLIVDGMINKNGGFLRAINKNLKARIAQVKINLERLRFLPKKMESSYAFINTAFAEFSLIKNVNSIMKFKTVVGAKTRRTPSKRDLIDEIVFNPTWIIPASILKRDKLAKIQADIRYLTAHNILIVGKDNQEYSPFEINWNAVAAETFPYQLVQQSGVHNSLGAVKFPLNKNADNIYMHDTNEKKLFAPEIYDRHRSSGCVRLEKPLEFAEYLLKSSEQADWNLEMLRSIVPPLRSEADLVTREIKLGKALPVYMIYLTVDVGENGQIRFSEDIYGQDRRFLNVLNSISSQVEESVQPKLTGKRGSLMVIGESGPSQFFAFVKAIPCKELNGKVQKASCRIDSAVAVPLNTKFKLAFGTYILGFENSVYPGFVRISAKPQKIQLEKIELTNFENTVSSAFYRVVRDFSEVLEKSKNPFQTYFVQQPIFSLAQYSFGGLYLKGSLQKDISSRLNYRICESERRVPDLSAEAQALCEIIRSSNLALSVDLFVTNKINGKASGTFTEKWINEDVMDIVEVKHPYHLVAAPLKFGEFVSVFPGSYRVVNAQGRVVQKYSTEFKNASEEYKMLFMDYEAKNIDSSDDKNNHNSDPSFDENSSHLGSGNSDQNI